MHFNRSMIWVSSQYKGNSNPVSASIITEAHPCIFPSLMKQTAELTLTERIENMDAIYVPMPVNPDHISASSHADPCIIGD